MNFLGSAGSRESKTGSKGKKKLKKEKKKKQKKNPKLGGRGKVSRAKPLVFPSQKQSPENLNVLPKVTSPLGDEMNI